MKRKFIYYAIACMLLSINAMAQLKVSGRVTNASDKTPLPNVTIQIKGTSNGTITSESGTFTIQVPDASSVLIFSFTGFTSKEVTVGNQTNISVALEESASQLNDIVVIGYGSAKKSDLTGSVASVKAEQLMDRPVPNVSQALQGKVAGVDVNINSSAPGQVAKVRIRGIGSINSNIDPLYVVDGVIGVDANALNPSDIASIEVLKDASSTAIFGARGANGVIIVSTKRGVRGQTRVSYEGNVNVSELYRHLPTLNSDEFVKTYNLAFANATKFDPDHGTWAPDKALNHTNFPLLFDANDKPLYNTNWEKEVYKPAISHSHYINVQGGSEKSLFSLSAGYLDQDGLMTESWFKRYSTRLTFDNDVNKWLSVGGNVSVISSKQRVVSESNGALNVPRMVSEEVPILPVKYPDGSWAGNNDIAGLEGGPNPVHIAQNRYTLNNNLQAIGDAYLNFHITKDLDFKTDFGYNLNSTKANYFSAADLPHLSADQGGVATITNNTNTYWQSENYLTWNKKINERQRMTALVGISFQRYNNENFNTEEQNFISDFFQYHNLGAGSVRQTIGSGDYQWSMNSYFARVTYNINEKYLFTATGRYDGSSRFGENNKYAFFPSVGAGWNISQEEFMKKASWIDLLKLRASYGISGNQEIGQYLSQPQIVADNTPLGGANASILLPGYIGNPDLKWERSLQFDAGLEFAIFNGRINLNLDYYRRTTKDLLLQAPIPWSAGMRTANVYQNVGSVRNSGIEVNLQTVNVKSKNLTWTTNFIFTSNKNEILNLNRGNADIFPGPNFLGQTNVLRVGQPIGSFYGMTRLGTYSTDEAAEAAQHSLLPGDRKYIYNADGTPYYSIIGRAYPKWTGMFSSTLKYKNWDFSFDIRIVEGVNAAATFKHSTEDRQTLANSLKTVLDAWTPEHQNTMIAQVRSYKFTQDSHFDTWWVEDASFIRGQNFTLGYNFPESMFGRTKINRLRVYASVQNLFVITDYSGYDPEVETFNTTYGSNSAFSQNLDFFSYPRPRVWNLGVSLGF
ncbi:TonB-linked outer membrane protein, SusC/RagA family [Chitinophaga rupis]|uniref:TonB-linked outer membrane protein, SusC/RagA family n=1 Tax=Chitinophaga rupis TaxID=573321 RepID=A0A1H7VSA9_9BACT|nr:TonB-dependent receptor [Chitinophaga rupis]SEM12106.1 TonB-linked outer membrane protein, SusC/RagA family [Chitinophaga rupis]